MTVTGPVMPGEPLFAPAASLFGAYRAHHGHAGAPEATLRWLRDQVTRGRLRLDVASDSAEALGLITTAVVPASLTLREFWLVRDLYVAPAYRRRGAGRALLGHVAEAARRDGAVRLSLQTEAGNAAALRLYESQGFRPAGELRTLILPL